LPPAGKGGRSPRRAGSRRGAASSIRAAAATAAGSTPAPASKTTGKKAAPLSPSSATKPKTRPKARPEARPKPRSQPQGPAAIGRPEGGAPSFPDYEAHSETWDPWEPGDEEGRVDPDFDAQRTLGEWLEGVIPPDAQVHFINAGREFAQGVQVTVDHHTGRRRAPDDGGGGPSRIEIE
jgi:hypothetical protein